MAYEYVAARGLGTRKAQRDETAARHSVTGPKMNVPSQGKILRGKNLKGLRSVVDLHSLIYHR